MAAMLMISSSKLVSLTLNSPIIGTQTYPAKNSMVGVGPFHLRKKPTRICFHPRSSVKVKANIQEHGSSGPNVIDEKDDDFETISDEGQLEKNKVKATYPNVSSNIWYRDFKVGAGEPIKAKSKIALFSSDQVVNVDYDHYDAHHRYVWGGGIKRKKEVNLSDAKYEWLKKGGEGMRPGGVRRIIVGGPHPDVCTFYDVRLNSIKG